ncbi:uncharacterized protein JCM15063_006448 [Sporobolomyces koalae]|uniref:uncharacterized protein n=1 Tax=Sporobolomyces koalae TaxID=500713 RepID=UPI00317A4A73
MDHHHSPAMDRLIRRQRVGPEANAAAAGDGSTNAATSSSSAAQAAVTTTSRAPETTSQAPAAQTTTTTTPQQVTTTSSPAAASTTTTTTVAPVESSSTSTTTTSSSTTPSSSAVVSSSTTTTSTSTAATTASSSSSSLSRIELTSTPQDATSTSARTTVVIVNGTPTIATASTAALANATEGSSSGSSIGTGSVIGIVAGAVVGVVFVAALIAFLFKKYSRKHDDDVISPFDRDEFHRASVMLDDDDDAYAQQSLHSFRGPALAAGVGPPGAPGGHSPQMSEYSMSNVGVGAILPGLARGGTLNNPRPPTAIMNHYQHQQMMPSFQPGQVVPAGQGYSPPLGGDPYASYPQAPQPVQYADNGGLSTAAAGHWNGIAPPMMMNYSQQQQNLSRANSQVSSYSQFSDGGPATRAIVPGPLRPGASSSSHSHGHPDERPLSLVYEHDDEHAEPLSANQRGRVQSPIEYVQERSGTPTDRNVQQTFFHGTERTGHDGTSSQARLGSGEWNQDEEEREQAVRRRLSIRNGGLDHYQDDQEDDPYGGIN